MSAVLIATDLLKCTHSFKITVTPPVNRKLTVSGTGVLVKDDASTWIPACTAGQTKCTKVSGVSDAGQSKLNVSGSPALVSSFTATTDKGPISATATQTKLKAG